MDNLQIPGVDFSFTIFPFTDVFYTIWSKKVGHQRMANFIDICGLNSSQIYGQNVQRLENQLWRNRPQGWESPNSIVKVSSSSTVLIEKVRVVYFDQHLCAAHSKCFSRSPFPGFCTYFLNFYVKILWKLVKNMKKYILTRAQCPNAHQNIQ